MKKYHKIIKDKSLLFLVIAITILCAGFIFISCGSDSELKVADPGAGAFALDFDECPEEANDTCVVALTSTSFSSEETRDAYSIQGKELTMEAWIKPIGTSTATILKRMEARGAELFITGVDDDTVKPNFKIRRVIESATGEGGTSTVQYIVSSTTNVDKNVWSHVAGLLVNKDHSGTEKAECTAPHLDIYVNGTYSNCATTLGGKSFDQDDDDVAHNDNINGEDLSDIMGFAHNPSADTLGLAFNGVVDEARLWTTDRTDKLVTCKDTELDDGSGDCGRDNENLIAYLRFNEGEGHTVNDLAGLGMGGLEYKNPDFDENVDDPDDEFFDWTTGWVADDKQNFSAAD